MILKKEWDGYCQPKGKPRWCEESASNSMLELRRLELRKPVVLVEVTPDSPLADRIHAEMAKRGDMTINDLKVRLNAKPKSIEGELRRDKRFMRVQNIYGVVIWGLA